MSALMDVSQPLPGAAFGAVVRLVQPLSVAQPDGLPHVLTEAGGLLLIPDAHQISRAPELLVRLSRLFGPEVEDYRHLLTGRHMVHESQPEIYLVTNAVPGARPPPA